MSRKILFLLLAAIPFAASAQFKTSYAQTGNRITEILDPSMMKQGAWRYFDLSGNLIREEQFQDHVLQSRKYYAGRGIVTDTSITEQQISLPASFSQYHGEVLTDSRGRIVSMSFYHGSPSPDARTKKQIKKLLEKFAGNRHSFILTF